MCRTTEPATSSSASSSSKPPPPPTTTTMSDDENDSSSAGDGPKTPSTSTEPMTTTTVHKRRRRRGQRDKEHSDVVIELRRQLREERSRTNGDAPQLQERKFVKKKKKKISAAKRRHEADAPSGGFASILPSLVGLVLLGTVILTKRGFRGRATVAGIDLGTTNSVVCVQVPAKGVGEIECIPDPATGSPIVPSVVSFLSDHHGHGHHPSKKKRKNKKKKNDPASSLLDPYPFTEVLVGTPAKIRIDTHPRHTLYHAKRVLGVPYGHDSVTELRNEVEFDVVPDEGNSSNCNSSEGDGPYEGGAEEDSGAELDGDGGSELESEKKKDRGVLFRVPFHHYHHHHHSQQQTQRVGAAAAAAPAPHLHQAHHYLDLPPSRIGSYVVQHLMNLAQRHLGHSNVRSAVVAIPAKFNPQQRSDTLTAFADAGIKVMRVLEEPTAAALAYGLHKKTNVEHILVYDFGGGTLDVSVLRVSDGGYVDVLGVDGDNRLGGADFDAAVAKALLEKSLEVAEGGGGDGTRRLKGWDVVQGVAEAVEEVFKAIAAASKERGEGDCDAAGISEEEEEEDVEELLAASCPALSAGNGDGDGGEGKGRESIVPLCTLSSFHTLGERIKIELSSYPDGGGVAKERCLGVFVDDDGPSPPTAVRPQTVDDLCGTLRPVELILTSSEYNHAVNHLYHRSLDPIRRLLSDLGLDRSEIDEVVMVGGTTRMPRIRHLVRNELGVERLNTSIDPDLTVAYGAASVVD